MNLFGKKTQQPHPLLAQIEKAKELTQFTPDVAELELFESHLLFVPDDMKQRHKQHGLLEEPSYEGVGFTRDTYTFWKQLLGDHSFPVALKAEEGDKNSARIKGELFYVKPSSFLTLDTHRANGVHFDRVRVPIAFYYHHQQHPARQFKWNLRAFMYVGRREYWWPQVEIAHLVKTFRPVTIYNNERIGPYYDYSLPEANGDIV